MSTRRRSAVWLLPVLFVAGLLAGCFPPAPPAPTPPDNPPPRVVGPATDFATDVYSDPWDFSNPEDFNTNGGVQSANLGNLSLTGGFLHFDTPGGPGYFDLAYDTQGAFALGRDTRVLPIDSGRYSQLSFSMRSTAPDNTTGQILWFTCPELSQSCQGNTPILKTGGGNFTTYNFDLHGGPHGGVAWSGWIYGIRIIPSAAPATMDFDWVRLHNPLSPVAPPANAQPLAVVDSPSSVGGADYATTVRGDAWDFSQPSDVAGSANAVWGVGNGVLNGYNYGQLDDPQIQLAMAAPIDGARFHHVTIHVWYAGSFGLQAGPGGGMVARLIWTIVGHPAEPQDSEDIVVYPGWNTISVDMATNPVSAVVDTNTPFTHFGWYGQQIATLRFDPDEDSGPRQFVVDDIRITDDATGVGGYPIQFHDNAWEPGTVANVYVQGGDGASHLLGTVPMTGPSASFQWTGASAGKWYPYVIIRDPAGQQSVAYASGPLRIT